MTKFKTIHYGNRTEKVEIPEGYEIKPDGKIKKGNKIYFSREVPTVEKGFRDPVKSDNKLKHEYGRPVQYFRLIIQKVEPKPVDGITPLTPEKVQELKKEFLELSLAELTDDVSIDPEGMKLRGERLEEIEHIIGAEVNQWDKEAVELAKKTGMASGAEFQV